MKYEKKLFDLSQNDDLFQKMEIFHTVASGKSNLDAVSIDKIEVNKFRNIEVK